MIKKQEDKYYIYSKLGKKLSKGYTSRKEVERRLREIAYLF